MKEQLFMAAFLPPEEVAKREHTIKQEIADNFGVKKALEQPAHITVIPPFKADTKGLERYLRVFEQECAKMEPFAMKIDGFDKFRKDVIFIKVKEVEPAKHFHARLQTALTISSGVRATSLDKKTFTPHMTIAYRDITPQLFDQIWADYKNREFKADFPVHTLHLLKHGKVWEPYKSFQFKMVQQEKVVQGSLF